MQLRMLEDLRYLEEGSGIPVVWIHAFPLSSAIFESQLALNGMRHLAPDLPGFGSTPPRGMGGLDDYADLILRFAIDVGAPRFIVGGVSMGGYIAMAVLRRASERVAGLMLLDTRETADAAEAAAKRLETAERIERDGDTSALVEEMLPKMLTEQTRRSNQALVDSTRRIMDQASPEGVAAALRAMAARPDSADVLRGFAQPMLIITGAEDTLTPPSDAERMKALAPSAELRIIAKASHLANVEQPGEVNEAVTGYLQRVEKEMART